VAVETTLPIPMGETVLSTSLPSIDNYLGRIHEYDDPTYGPQKVKLVKNTSASSIAAARSVVTEDGETVSSHVELSSTDSPHERFQGVTVAAIGVGYVGWVVVRGECLALAGTGGITADLPIAMGGTAGGFITAVAREGRFQRAGGAAGAHAITGIKAEDRLISFVEQDGTSGLITDRTSEVVSIDDDVVDNTGGTATTGDVIIARWEKAAGGPVGTGMAAITATNTGRIRLG
jgi:hypothetical protein